jgi:NADH-quinone oxidoreductase subunit F
MAMLDLEAIAGSTEQRLRSTAYRVLVCCGLGCMAYGSETVYRRFADLTGAYGGLEQVELTRGDGCGRGLVSGTGCRGMCQMGPLVTVRTPKASPYGEFFYCQVKPDDVPDIICETLGHGRPVDRLLYTHPITGQKCLSEQEIPFYAGQTRLVFRDSGYIEPDSIEEYIYRGGYAAARKAITGMTPQEVCNLVKDSGLRGRGGAGFPAGDKWLTVLKANSDEKYLIGNGDEGDPGAFVDRGLMEGDPHRIVEGAVIAGYGIGARRAFMYIRAEYPLAVKRVRRAISDARALGLIGRDLFGMGFDFECEVVEGAGAFVCGESSALVASIEGKRGVPRQKPPRLSERGLFGKPTVVNNVETLATVRYIIAEGPRAFRQYGTALSPGTKAFALTGRVRNSGRIEVPLGTPLKQIVHDIGGGIPDGRDFKAVQIGGPSGGCLGAEHLDMPLDFESLPAVGAMVGSGGIVVLDDTSCMVEVARFFMQFTQNESCGKCVACREGTKQMLAILQDMVDGTSRPGDIDLLQDTATAVSTASLCGLGKSAPNPVLSTLALFKSEYKSHIERRLCPAGVCQALRVYSIDPDACTGCTLCVAKCPVGAITGEKRKAHQIDVGKCTKCGLCAAACKFQAIIAA